MKPATSDFVAPMPERLPEGTSIWRKLQRTRENLVAGWTEDCFRWQRFEFSVLNQRYIVCNSARNVRTVFLDKHANFDRKSPQMRRALAPLLGDGLFVSDGELWATRRALCAPALRPALLTHFAPRMIETAEELVGRWRGRDGERIDVLAEMGQLTARIIGRTVFGDDTSQDEAAQVVAGFTQYQASIEQLDLAASLGLPFLKLMPGLSRPVDMSAAHKVHEVIDRIIARHGARAAKAEAVPTLLSLFLDAETGEAAHCPLSAEAARNEAIVMFMAGHETTANTLAWALYLITAAPRCGALLREEADRVFGSGRPTIDDVPRLTYTRAVIEETLRLYPPVPVLSRQARQDDQVGTCRIRAGDIILVVPWLLHRHDLFWDSPNAFRPERFMAPDRRPDRFLYIPFSVGPRVCLGQRFGLVESILCLAIIAQRFELQLEQDQRVDVSGRLTLRPRGGLPMSIQARPSS